MDWEITERSRDTSKEVLMFIIKDKSNNTKYSCGVTQIAINDYYKTDDTIEHAEQNFENNTNFIVNKALNLIEKGIKNNDGCYIINRTIIEAANII